MVEHPTDLYKNKLQDREEINIVYEGPSFQEQMEITPLVSQLKSTENLIRDLIDELYTNKKIPINSEKTKIFLKLKRGSFQEIISVVLNHPILIGVISGCLVVLFERLLKKHKTSHPDIKIEQMNIFKFRDNINNIINPLQTKNDKIKISSVYNPSIKTVILFDDKEIVKDSFEDIEKDIHSEELEEEFLGYLSSVDIDKDKFRFTLEKTNKRIPVDFESNLSLEDIRNILGKRIKIHVNSYYKNKGLSRLKIKEYQLKKRKDLKDYRKSTN